MRLLKRYCKAGAGVNWPREAFPKDWAASTIISGNTLDPQLDQYLQMFYAYMQAQSAPAPDQNPASQNAGLLTRLKRMVGRLMRA